MTGKACAALVLAVAIAGCIGLAACSSTTGGSSTSSTSATEAKASTSNADTSYADKLFDTSTVHTIDITISDEDWADLKANPLEKTKYQVDATIDGEKASQISFATKGNTSLSSVATDEGSDRYSFKINFGKYVDGQTYHGLDKLNLNNLYADSTYMKDYMSYEIFRAMGVDAPLTSYVQVKVNGEDLGLYLAIEDVNESYLDRTEDGEGELYKPETEMLGNMDKVGGDDAKKPEGMNPPEGMSFPEGMNPPDGANPPEGMNLPEGMNFPGGAGGTDGGNDGDGSKAPDGGFMGGMMGSQSRGR